MIGRFLTSVLSFRFCNFFDNLRQTSRAG